MKPKVEPPCDCVEVLPNGNWSSPRCYCHNTDDAIYASAVVEEHNSNNTLKVLYQVEATARERWINSAPPSRELDYAHYWDKGVAKEARYRFIAEVVDEMLGKNET